MSDKLCPKYSEELTKFVKVLEKTDDHEVRRKVLGDFVDSYTGVSIMWTLWIK